MLTSLRTRRGRIVIALILSIGLAVLWAAYDGPIAMLPALIVPFWIPIFTRQQESVSPGSRRFMLASFVVGALLFLVLAGIYVAYS